VDVTEAALTVATRHHRSGRLAEAERLYRQILLTSPHHGDALFLLATLLHQQGALDEAEAAYRRALAARPDHPDSHNNLGLLLHQRSKSEEARACLAQAIRLRPDFVDAHNNLGLLLHSHGDLDAAIAHFTAALAVKPDYAAAHNNLGITYFARGDLAEAARCFCRVLALRPDFAEASLNLGMVRQHQGQLHDAILCFRQALFLEPGSAQAHLGLGSALRQSGRLDEAQTSLERAVALAPDLPEIRHQHALALLATGDYRRGFPDYRPETAGPPSTWKGEALAAGTPLLIDAGPDEGEALLLARYAAFAAAQGARVTLACPPSLVALMAGVAGVAEVIDRDGPAPPAHLRVRLTELPARFGTTFETVPDRVPYLDAPQGGRLPPARPGTLRVGLACQARPATDRLRALEQERRWCPPEALAPLLALPGVTWYSLQPECPGESCIDLATQAADLATAAGLLVQLDLVIATDTPLAHLAGALGCPLWLLVDAIPDWRWLISDGRCRWYPAARLFRQTAAGQWFEPIAAICQALASRRP